MPDTLSYEEIEKMLEHVPVVLYKYVLFPDGNSKFLYLSSGCKDILGYPESYFLENIDNFWGQIHEEDIDQFHKEDVIANREGKLFLMVCRYNHPERGVLWLHISSKPTGETYDGSAEWTGYMVDITDQKKLEGELREMATHDSLTGLLNRSVLMDALDTEVSRFKRYGETFSLLMMDLDHFKEVNDTYGHLVGDDVLRMFARVSESTLRDADSLGRYGGEEFLAMLPKTSVEAATEIAERVRVAVSNESVSAENVQVTVSIGVTEVCSGKDETAQLLIERADRALYIAKESGRNRTEVVVADADNCE